MTFLQEYFVFDNKYEIPIATMTNFLYYLNARLILRSRKLHIKQQILLILLRCHITTSLPFLYHICIEKRQHIISKNIDISGLKWVQIINVNFQFRYIAAIYILWSFCWNIIYSIRIEFKDTKWCILIHHLICW